ncbi:AIR synthase related protein, partial [Alcaligenes pakistanensis]
AFSKGLFQLADQAHCPLIGGDTTRSKQGVVISITVLGEVPAGQALQRSAAKPGDDIWLTGTLGAADIALRLLQGRLA